MEHTHKDFSTSYLEISFHLSEILTDEEYDQKLFKTLSFFWDELKIPNDQGNLTTEVQLLNTRLLLLFFDSEFRRDLKETISAYGSLLDDQMDIILSLERNHLEILTMFMQDEYLDKARCLREKLIKNWAINFNYLKDNTVRLSSFVYGLSEFDLKGHNKRLQTILKAHPDLSPDTVSNIRFDGGGRHLMEVDLRYSIETNIKLFERKLKELYSNQLPAIKQSNNTDKEKFFSPFRISNLFSVQPQHKHFEIHEKALKISHQKQKLKADTVAGILCDELSHEGYPAEQNTIAKIIKDLPLITRPFHPTLSKKRDIIY